MSAVRRWTWPILVPEAIGRSARAIGVTASSLIPTYCRDAPRRAPGPSALSSPAPGSSAVARLAHRDAATAQERARGRRGGAGGPAAQPGVAHVARADPRGARARQHPTPGAARRVLLTLTRPAAQVQLRVLAAAGDD